MHVRDNGIGIAQPMRAQVFDLFVQDERALDRSHGGVGIGLALARHLVELHRGRVEAYSDGPGKGRDFVVRLPVIRAGTAEPETDATSLPCRQGVRVMIADDDRDAAESLSMVLQLYGYEVATATDLASTLRVAAQLAPQVIVLDLGMPGADGFEVARTFRGPAPVASRTTS